MKKVILSMVCMFAISTIVNAATLSGRNCVEEAINAGNDAEARGANDEIAYHIADHAYLKCEIANRS